MWLKEVARAIFYMHQTSGACAGECACDRTHQMEKIEMGLWLVDISYMKYLPPKASYKIALAGDYFFIVSIQFEICSWSNPAHKKGIFLIL